jgi:hypothetical protein
MLADLNGFEIRRVSIFCRGGRVRSDVLIVLSRKFVGVG